MSSTNYRLVDDGYPTFKKIKCGNRAVGRVAQTDGGYFGIIGRVAIKAKTEDEAFKEIVARHCGHASYSAMAAKNTAVRTINRQRKAEARYVTDELIQGNFKPLNRMFGLIDDKEEES
jgi:hypothetical protein